ncbi:DUF5810 domain-containing protein [Halopelagius longus]|uniref:Uncharacterized protein n=2 Tax=Halopelagius longus TaxID=1236180 RepID=A0A1H0XY84_9EURY|nr:DUF5810 domain-containing protein [Halopelagius longus]RDI73106.1 hypothetical protein DWB78_10840 [Halopelagius longus]SDQ07843.1 hypothetical protein SAMN05216278_0276 [Halopelagius longus]
MGYACPVCDTPQRDAEHLANHVAFTAMLHGDEHETWLDDHVPEWSSTNADELGPVVAEYAEETEYEEVFEDTVHDHGGHGRTGHDHGSPFEGGAENPGFNASAAAGMGGETLDDEARAVLQEAREMTERMREERAADEDGGRTDDE